MNPKYYQESGDLDFSNFMIGTLILIAITCIMAYPYAVITKFIPIIYFNIVIAIFFGFGLSFAIRLVDRWIRSRNKLTRILLVIIAVLFFTYFQWAAFIESLALDKSISIKEYLTALLWIFNPKDFFFNIAQVYQYGTWGLGAGSIVISGFLLLLIWIVEIAIIAMPSVKDIFNYKAFPFSEKFNKWYPKFTIENDFEFLASKKNIEQKLDSNVYEAISSLELGSSIRHSKVHLYYLADEDLQYLSIDKVYVESGSDPNTVSTSVIENYIIDNQTAEMIQSQFKLKRNRLEVI